MAHWRTASDVERWLAVTTWRGWRLSPLQHSICGYIARQADNRKGVAYASQRTMAKDLACSRDNIWRCLTKLCRQKLLVLEHRGSHHRFDTNRYRPNELLVRPFKTAPDPSCWGAPDPLALISRMLSANDATELERVNEEPCRDVAQQPDKGLRPRRVSADAEPQSDTRRPRPKWRDGLYRDVSLQPDKDRPRPRFRYRDRDD
jgi:hypothetical protein